MPLSHILSHSPPKRVLRSFGRLPLRKIHSARTAAAVAHSHSELFGFYGLFPLDSLPALSLESFPTLSLSRGRESLPVLRQLLMKTTYPSMDMAEHFMALPLLPLCDLCEVPVGSPLVLRSESFSSGDCSRG